MKLKGNGMNTSIFLEARIEKIKITSHDLIVHLVDGRRLDVPLVWFPRLAKATAAQRNKYRLIGEGVGINWPLIDEDLSAAGLLSCTSPVFAETTHQ